MKWSAAAASSDSGIGAPPLKYAGERQAWRCSCLAMAAYAAGDSAAGDSCACDLCGVAEFSSVDILNLVEKALNLGCGQVAAPAPCTASAS